jgi:hypothetical protein
MVNKIRLAPSGQHHNGNYVKYSTKATLWRYENQKQCILIKFEWIE